MPEHMLEAAESAALSRPQRADDDPVWVVHYHDGRSMQQTRFRAHCRDCAWTRFERQNDDCRVPAVLPVSGEPALAAAERPQTEPITMGDDDMYCAPECRYLARHPTALCQGTCQRDGQPLDYHDWYLAHCKGQTEN